MTKRNYKEVATRLYKEDTDEYIKLYESVRNLVNLGLLDRDWLDFIWNFDKILFVTE